MRKPTNTRETQEGKQWGSVSPGEELVHASWCSRNGSLRDSGQACRVSLQDHPRPSDRLFQLA
jgi:hypothetical protein